MRIISGKYKGKTIRPPRNFRARPTTDFAKEALFNILHNKLDFSIISVLDLFSGTGSIGFEFVSRNAFLVDMVEKDPVHHHFIKQTLTDMKMENARIFRADVFYFLDHAKQSYDLIFADPPYDMRSIEEIPDRILHSGILNPDGLFILEHSRRLNYKEHPYCYEERVYGNVHFSFFSKNIKLTTAG